MSEWALCHCSPSDQLCHPQRKPLTSALVSAPARSQWPQGLFLYTSLGVQGVQICRRQCEIAFDKFGAVRAVSVRGQLCPVPVAILPLSFLSILHAACEHLPTAGSDPGKVCLVWTSDWVAVGWLYVDWDLPACTERLLLACLDIRRGLVHREGLLHGCWPEPNWSLLCALSSSSQRN